VELRHLRYFVAVAEELHFGRAAMRLSMAQPPLSQQIRRLEAEIGAPLFSRTKRRVELTAAGRALLPEAQRLLARAEHAVRTAQRASRGESGRLAVGLVPSAGLELLPRVLRAWLARFPRVELEPRLMYPEQQVEALRTGVVQAGLLRPPVDDPDVVVEPILREPLVAALPQRHRLGRRPCVRLAELRNDTLIAFPRRVAPRYYDHFVDLCRRDGFRPRIVEQSASIPTNLGLVAAGLGVALLPAAVRVLHRRGVVYRPLAPPEHVEMALAWLADETPPIVAAFLDVVRAVARGAAASGVPAALR